MVPVAHRSIQVTSPAARLVIASLVQLAVSWVAWAATDGSAADARAWVPVGLALGFVAAWGARVLPGVVLATGLAAWLAGASNYQILGHLVAVTFTGWAGGALWRSILNAPGSRTASDRILWLAPVALGATLVSAVFVHLQEFIAGDRSTVAVGMSIVRAWFGHLTVTLVAAPLLWVWTRPAERRAKQRVWLTLAVLGLPILLALAVWAPVATDTSRAALAFLAIPFVFLAAVRYNARRTALVAGLVSSIAIVGTLRGMGPFAEGDAMAIAGLASLSGGTTLLAVFLSTLWAERRHLRESLESSQRRWRDLVRSAPEVILAVDRNGVVQMTNHRGEGTMARLRETESVFDALIPEHRQRLREKLDVVFWNGTDTHVEVDVISSGAPRTYLMQMGPLRDAERVNGAMIIGQDVTERNRMMGQLAEREERLRAVYDRSPVPIALLTPDGHVLEFNLALEQMLAAGDLSLDGYEMAAIVHPEDREQWVERFRGLARGARSRFEDEIRLVRRDGSPVWTRVTATSVREGDGDIRFCVTQWEDQSASQRANEAERLADSRASEIGRLEEVNAWKSELLHIASHEIRNPLTPIRLQLDLLDRQIYGPMTEKQERSVRVMRNECDRLASLVTGILDAARVESNRLVVHPRDMDMAAVVRDMAATFEPLAEEHGIGFEVQTTGDEHMAGDPERIGQVIVNLLSNAFKFTPAHGHIRVHARRNNDRIIVQVTDTGPGLDDAQQEKLFQAFSQVHDTSRGDHHGGIGLGLYVSKGIIEAHGGSIWCESPGQGKGATFGFEVPVHSPGDAAPTAMDAATRRAAYATTGSTAPS